MSVICVVGHIVSVSFEDKNSQFNFLCFISIKC